MFSSQDSLIENWDLPLRNDVETFLNHNTSSGFSKCYSYNAEYYLYSFNDSIVSLILLMLILVPSDVVYSLIYDSDDFKLWMLISMFFLGSDIILCQSELYFNTPPNTETDPYITLNYNAPEKQNVYNNEGWWRNSGNT
jgi:hypothetical protein